MPTIATLTDQLHTELLKSEQLLGEIIAAIREKIPKVCVIFSCTMVDSTNMTLFLAFTAPLVIIVAARKKIL